MPRLTPEQLLEYGGAHYARDLIQARARVGGIGTPDFETTAIQPSYRLGVPDGWSDDISLEDLPRYESQASYLRRLDLLMPGELKRIKKAQYLPEIVTIPMQTN